MILPKWVRNKKPARKFSAESIYDKDGFKIVEIDAGDKPSALCFGAPDEVKLELGAGVKVSPVMGGQAQFKYGSGKTYHWNIVDYPTLVDRFIPPEEKPTYLASNVAYASGTVTTSSTSSFISLSVGQEIRVDTPTGKFTLEATDEGLKLVKPGMKRVVKVKRVARSKDLERGFRPSVRK